MLIHLEDLKTPTLQPATFGTIFFWKKIPIDFDDILSITMYNIYLGHGDFPACHGNDDTWRVIICYQPKKCL